MVKIGKKTVVALSTAGLFIVLLLTSCSMFQKVVVSDECNPGKALEQFLGIVSSGDYAAAIESTGNKADSRQTEDVSATDFIMLEQLRKYFRCAPTGDYVVDGGKAWQDVEITTLDMRLVVRKLIDGAMEETRAYEWKHGSYKTDEEIMAALRASFREQLAGDLSDCLTTQRLKLTFRYYDGDWHVEMTDGLYTVMTGYSAEAAESVLRYIEDTNSQSVSSSESE